MAIDAGSLATRKSAGRGDFYARLDYGVDVYWGAYSPTS
jgi:hypothetical protein